MQTLEYHPIASIFPMMPEEALAKLAEDVRQQSLREPVTLFEGKVLDGRNRVEACRRLGIEPTAREFLGTRLEAVAYVWSQNRMRRHLTSSQAAMAEARRAKMCQEYAVEIDKLRSEAQQRKAAAGKHGPEGGRGKKKPSGKEFPKGFDHPTETARAKAAGTNRKYVESAERLIEEAPDLAKQVETGQATIPQARTQLYRRKKRKELDTKAQAAAQLRDGGKLAWEICQGDCLEILPRFTQQARLVFADPPYNIGIDYGEGKAADRWPDDRYLAWVEQWLAACRDVLSSDGSLWVLIGDEYAAEYAVTLKRLGLSIRSWVKWYESFGVNCASNFNRCSRHLFYCVRDPKRFVFNEDAVTRPSDRQAKYNDKRAHPGGKLWDNVWGIHPPIPRLTGTCQERVPDFPTQLPLALLEPIVLCASEPGDLVLDPFNGSGTTGVAAIRHGRRYLGVERSERFAELARLRLKGVDGE